MILLVELYHLYHSTELFYQLNKTKPVAYEVPTSSVGDLVTWCMADVAKINKNSVVQTGYTIPTYVRGLVIP